MSITLQCCLKPCFSVSVVVRFVILGWLHRSSKLSMYFLPLFVFCLTVLIESGYTCSEGSLQRGPLQLQTTVTRRLLLQNYLLKYLEQTQSGLGGVRGGSWGKLLLGLDSC